VSAERPVALRGFKTGTELINELNARKLKAPLRTNIVSFDALQGAGLSRGTLVELSGPPSSGRYALGLTALAAATRLGESAALVDLGDHLDPRAAQQVGVDLSRLLLVRPKRFQDALSSADLLLATGFSIVVLDLGIKPFSLKYAPNHVWQRLARAAETHDGILFVLSPIPLHSTAPHVVMRTRNAQPVWHGAGLGPRLLSSLLAHADVKNRRGPERHGYLSFSVHPAGW